MESKAVSTAYTESHADEGRASGTQASCEDQLEMFKRVFESIYNGSMVTDAKGYVTHFNIPYGHFLGLNPQEQIGRHCTEVIENTRMHIVAQTGKPEINHVHRIKGQNMVVQRIPIKKDGKVIAVFGQVMFKDVRDVGKLAKKISLLESKVKHYEEELMTLRRTRYTFDSIVGNNKTMRLLKKEALKATANQFPVLITGESGTGKEIFAQAIHHGSARRLYPFVRINCSAIPNDLLESELFGYESGAFTGAKAGGKPGKIELAHRGTLFLDEIGDLPVEMQPKLLRVLEEKEFERVGGTKVIRSDFRLISATNQNLETLLEQNRFRKDLFYRLNVIPLHIPPLRERRNDIPLLVRHLLKQMAREAALLDVKMTPEAQEVLIRYAWPGNVRELFNVLERTLSTLEGDVVHIEDLPFYLHRVHMDAENSTAASIREIRSGAERKAILNALKRTRHNKAAAARILGIHRTLLYKKIKQYGITP